MAQLSLLNSSAEMRQEVELSERFFLRDRLTQGTDGIKVSPLEKVLLLDHSSVTPA